VAFLRACAAGRLVLVRAYLQNGGDVDAGVEIGGSPGSILGEQEITGAAALTASKVCYGLTEAVIGGHLEVAAKLLACGASMAIRVGPDQESPLHLACRGVVAAKKEAARYASSKAVAAGGGPRMVQLLLRVRADPCALTAKTRRTPLLTLAATCAEAAAEATLGEDTNAAAANEARSQVEGAGDVSAWSGAAARAAQLLLDEGSADPAAVDVGGRTALCYARSAGKRGDQLTLVLVNALQKCQNHGKEAAGLCARGKKCEYCS